MGTSYREGERLMGDGNRQGTSLKRALGTQLLAMLMFVVAALLVPSVASATALPATIKENTTLTSAGNPYTGTSTIESGVTLTVQPGVKFQNSSLTVKGTLKAEGTAEEPVIFTSAKEEKAGEWCGIEFKSGSGSSVVDHAEFRYGGLCNLGEVAVTEGSSPTIKNSTFSHSSGYAIKTTAGGSPEIANNRISTSANGIFYEGTTSGEVNIHGNEVEGGANGIYVSATGASVVGKTLGANTIKNTTGVAVTYKGTDIPGDITGNTLTGNKENIITIGAGSAVSHTETWNNGVPVKLEGNVTIASGVTLTITKGVLLKGSPSLTVKGTLKAEGTAEEPVIFTSAKEEKAGEWCGIEFKSGSGSSVVDHAEFRYGGLCNLGEVAVTEGSSPTIKNSTFSHSSGYAIKTTAGGSPEIANNRISTSANGIFYEGTTSGEVNIHGNEVEGGANGIYVSATGASVVGKTLGANTIKNTTGVAVTYKGTDIPGDITGNTLTGNKENIITIGAGSAVSHTETWNNGVPVKFEGNMTIASGVTLTITKGVFLTGAPSMTIKGTLNVEGTSAEPVIFTSAKEEKAGEWCGLEFKAGSGSSVVDHAEFRYGGQCNLGEIAVREGISPTIKNSTFSHSSGYAIKVTDSSHPVIEWNRFRHNESGLSYSGTGKLSAPNNDWNCASGPQPAGCGDAVTSNVDWKPDVPLPELTGHCRGMRSQCGEGADPVSLATGQLNYSHRDLLLTNKSAEPLEFTRAYYSGSSSDTGLGPGWSQTGLSSATELASGEVLVLREDGRQDLFQKTESGYEAPSGVTDALAKVEGTFQLTTLQNTVYRFDASGRIASITDDHGLKTTYAYNAEGRLATIADPSAQTLTFGYNASNHITSVKDSTGREVKFGYSAAGDLETVTDALSGVTKYGYDSQHRLTSITDPRSNVILKNVYNGEGKITEQQDGLKHLWKLEYKPSETIVTEPDGGKKKYGFDGQNRVVSETDQLGHTTTTSYDEVGNVKEVVQPGAAKWTFGHDAAGNLTLVKDPEGGERKYEYDGKNRLTHFTDARGSSWDYEWSEANNLTKVTDPEGGETTLTYNESGQPLTKTDPGKHKTEFAYDTRGNRTSETDPLGHKTSFEYNNRNYVISKTLPGQKAEGFERDALGDLLARTTPEGRKTKYVYDANGLPTQVTDPGENVWKIEYNAMERPVLYTDPLEGQVKVAYNGDLKPTKVVNRRGKETTYGYDLADQLTEVHRPEGEDWTYAYDARGNRTSMIDPREHETTYEYDLLNRMTDADEPLEVTTEYGYDANGELTSVKDPRGDTTSYSYDKLGQLTEVDQPLERTTSFAYDAVGNQLSRTTAAGTLEFAYDAANRLTKVSEGESALRSYGYDAANRTTSAIDAQGAKIEIGYNEDGLISSINDGRGQSLTRNYNSRDLLAKQVDGRGALEYSYDKLGRLTSLTDPQGKALGFAYDPEGDLTEVTRPNGVTTANVYNDAGRLAETTSIKGGEPLATLESIKYGYDPAGNVTGRIDQRLEQETTYAYDALNRLTEFNPSGEGATSYGYDKAGNRTEAGGVTYTYNALNQLTEASDGTTYSYDGAGRMTQKVKGLEETTYEWEPLDHLAKVEGSAEAASYAYDALGRLSKRTDEAGTQVAHYGGLTDLPTYDANGEGGIVTSYVQGPRGLVEQRSGEATAYPLVDAHGDVTAIADSTGGVESRQSYDPWGVQLSGPNLEMGFLGAQERRADPMSGLIQMGERSYDPSLGTFLSEDPVYGHFGIGASVDRYLYVWDNPLNRYDLSGRDVCVPTPFGDACAGDAAEDVVRIDEEFQNGINSAPENLWNLTAPGRHWIGDRARDFAKSDVGEWFGDRGDEVGRTFTCIAERVVQKPGPVGCQEAAEPLESEVEEPDTPDDPPNFPPPPLPGKDPLPTKR